VETKKATNVEVWQEPMRSGPTAFFAQIPEAVRSSQRAKRAGDHRNLVLEPITGPVARVRPRRSITTM
jgi:hypothetical protein